MNKLERMKENRFYHYENVNPKGKYTSDCVIRAIANALGQDWKQTYIEMVELGIKKGLIFNEKRVYEDYMEKKGFVKYSQPRKDDNTKYTIKEFLRENSIYCIGKVMVVSVANHLTCIKQSKVVDIWDCGNKTIGNYWVLNK